MTSPITIGVLAYHGSVTEHRHVLSRIGFHSASVRTVKELREIDALIIPGGESTTLYKLMRREGLDKEIVTLARAGMPLFGTCAGMIICAKHAFVEENGKRIEDTLQRPFNLIDIDVKRNDYGRQVESFESKIKFDGKKIPAVFIRAPVIKRVGSGVKVLATHDNIPVMCRHGNILVASFHPELTMDPSVHKYFAKMVAKPQNANII